MGEIVTRNLPLPPRDALAVDALTLTPTAHHASGPCPLRGAFIAGAGLHQCRVGGFAIQDPLCFKAFGGEDVIHPLRERASKPLAERHPETLLGAARNTMQFLG